MLTAQPPQHRPSSGSSGEMLSRRSHSRSGSFFEKSKRCSFAYAQQKIDYLAQYGYVFMGNLPSYKEVPSMQRCPMCRYLFMRNGKYYQFKGFEFLDEEFVLRLDEHHEPLDPAFSKIVEGDFIHLMVRERYPSVDGYSERLVLMLKPDASLSGHPLLAGPYGRKCGLLMMAKPPLEVSKEFLRKQMEALPEFPKSAFVLAENALFYLFQFGDELHCLPMYLSEDDVKKLKVELVKLALPIEETSFAEKECVCIAKELTPASYAKITQAARFNPEFEVIGGEVYFHNESILLINHKSNNFRSDAASAERLITALWGSHGAIAFHPAVEKPEVDHELAVRRDKFKYSTTFSYMSSPVLKFESCESKDFSAVKPADGKSETISNLEFQVSKPINAIHKTPTTTLTCPKVKRYSWFEADLKQGLAAQVQPPRPLAPSPNEEEQVKTGFCSFMSSLC